MSRFFDKIIPFFVGNRTQILAGIAFVLNALAGFDVIPAELVEKINDMIAPLGAMTLAAKIDRNSVKA